MRRRHAEELAFKVLMIASIAVIVGSLAAIVGMVIGRACLRWTSPW